MRGLRITGSGLQLSDDDAAIFVTGNRVTIENCVIADSLHGVYLKKVSGAQILNNRIQGKTTLTASTEPVEKGIGQELRKLRHHARIKPPWKRNSPMELRRQSDSRQ